MKCNLSIAVSVRALCDSHCPNQLHQNLGKIIPCLAVQSWYEQSQFHFSGLSFSSLDLGKLHALNLKCLVWSSPPPQLRSTLKSRETVSYSHHIFHSYAAHGPSGCSANIWWIYEFVYDFLLYPCLFLHCYQDVSLSDLILWEYHRD